MSPKRISRPVLLSSGNAVTAEVYVRDCLKRSAIPFIKRNYPDGNYLFWPDKASAHYAKDTIGYFEEESIKFVSKDKNPTNLVQFRPIKDFFGYLSGKVYKDNWKARSTKQLMNKIKKCI